MADYLKQFNTTAEYNTYINGTPDLPNVSLTLDNNEVHYNKKPDYSKEYLTFEALESGTFTFNKICNYYDISSSYCLSTTDFEYISYSIDDGITWTTLTNDGAKSNQTLTTPTINVGQKVLWKGKAKTYNKLYLTRYTIGCVFGSTGRFNVSGNIMSLLYEDNFIGNSTLPSNTEATFTRLFVCNYESTNKVVNAKNLVLPTNVNSRCYGNASSYNGYFGMFKGCTSLITAPELPATTLANSCYYEMFSGCTSLTTAPVLPATTLAQYCYQGMFAGCTSLNNITMLATNISASNCLTNWVDGVAATGTFTKAASMTTLPSGTSGIPANWTVVDA